MMVIMRLRAALTSALLAGCNLLIGVNDLVYTGPVDADGAISDAPGETDGPADASADAPPADAGCDADVATDPANCGACGHGCLGGTCDAGVCQPFLVTTGTNVVALASDGANLYLRSTTDIRSCPVGGCSGGGTFVASVGSSAIRRVRVTATDLLWNDGAHLYTCNKASCAPADRLTANANPVVDFWISDSIFWAAQSNGNQPWAYVVGKCPLTAGNCPQITSGASDAIGVVAGLGFDAYWSTSTSGILRCTGTCGVDASTNTTTALGFVTSLDPQQSAVWAGHSQGLARLGTDLTTALPIVSSGYVTRVLVDQNDVFFVDGSSRNVDRCPAVANACTPSVLRHATVNIDDLALDATAIYWTEGMSQVWRLAR